MEILEYLKKIICHIFSNLRTEIKYESKNIVT